MRIVSWDRHQGGVRIELSEGRIFLWAQKETMIRCVYTKHDFVENHSPLIAGGDHTLVDFRAEEEGPYLSFETGKIRVELDKDTGIMCWKEAAGGRILLQEAGKELSPTDVVKYTTGGEAPVINRV